MLLQGINDRIREEAQRKGGLEVRDVRLSPLTAGALLLTGVILGCAETAPPSFRPEPTGNSLPSRMGNKIFGIVSSAVQAEVLEYARGGRFETVEKILPVARRARIDTRPQLAEIRNALLAPSLHEFVNVRLCQTTPRYGVTFTGPKGTVTAILSVECPRMIWLQESGEGIPDELSSLQAAKGVAALLSSVLIQGASQ